MKWKLNIFKSKLKKLKKKNNQGFVPQKELRSVQLLSHVQLFASPWTAACQASLSITNSQSLLKLMSMKSVMPSNHQGRNKYLFPITDLSPYLSCQLSLNSELLRGHLPQEIPQITQIYYIQRLPWWLRWQRICLQ